MTTTTEPAAGRGFGAGTTPRFLLLSSLVLVTAVQVFERVNAVVAYDSRRDLLGGAGCFLAAGEDPAGDYQANQLALQRPGVSEALNACLRRFDQRQPGWPLLAEVGLLVVGAAVLYWLLPRWKARSGRVVPLDERIDPTGELHDLVRSLVDRAGLTPAPRFVVDPAARTPGAVVFGRWRRYTVVLHGGLLVRRTRDPAGFRAVVLHELAHLRNRDVDLTYATVALWRAYLVLLPAGVLVSVAYLLHRPSLLSAQYHRDSIEDLLQTVFLVVLVYLARADVLRVRELEADLSAAGWGADPGVWRRGAPDRPAGRWWRSVGAPWRTHPDWARRERLLTGPARQFDLPHLPVFLTGVAVLVAVGTAHSSLQALQRFDVQQATAVVGLFGAALATAVVGSLLWRSAVHGAARGRRRAPGVRTGLWFGAGLVTGELALARTTDRWLPERPQYLFVLLLIGVVTMWWTAGHVELWAVTRRGGSVRSAVLITLTATWFVFGTWFAWWQSVGQQWVRGQPIVDPQSVLRLYATHLPGLLDANSGPLAATAAVRWVLGGVGTDQNVLPGEHGLRLAGTLIWLLPLLTSCRRPAATGGLSLRRVGRGAAAGGLLAVAALAGLRWRLHDAVPPGAGRPAALLLYDSVWTVVALTAVAATAAVVAAARSGSHRLLTGLATAGFTVLLGQAVAFVLVSADGCLGPLDLVTGSCGWRPHEGWSLVADTTRYLLGPSMFAVAVVLLPVAGLRDRPVSPAVTAARRPRLVVTMAAVAVVVLGAASWRPAASVSSTTADGFAPTAADFPAASSPLIHEVRVLTWLKYGGQDLLNGISGRQNDFIALATTPTLTPADVVNRVRPVCAGIDRDVAAARAYFPVPDEEAGRYWTSYLDESGTAAATCLRAIDGRDRALFIVAGEQMQQTFFSHRLVYDRFQSFLH